MTGFPHAVPCPAHLEDEAFYIETSGEMPEVALEGSRLHCGPWNQDEELAMQAAAAKAYLAIIERDLNPANLGEAAFRGLERANLNLKRLNSFLLRCGQCLGPGMLQPLAEKLESYLRVEARALDGGRPYASAVSRDVLELGQGLDLPLDKWQGLLARMDLLPAPDFLGLRALARLGESRAAYKRQGRKGGRLIIELVTADQARGGWAALPILGPDGKEDPESLARARLVWSLLSQTPTD